MNASVVLPAANPGDACLDDDADLRLQTSAEIHALTHLWLSGRLRAMLRRLDDALFESAVNATRLHEQNLHFDAMRCLREQAEACVARFLAGHADGYVRLLGATATAPEPAVTDDLALTPDAALLIARATAGHADTLGALERLWQGLFGAPRPGSDAGPVAPRSLVAHCIATMRALAVPTAVLPLVLRQFEACVLDELDELCTRCAGVLVDAGVRSCSPPVGGQSVPVAVPLAVSPSPGARQAARGDLGGREMQAALADLQLEFSVRSMPAIAELARLVEERVVQHAAARQRTLAARDVRLLRSVALFFDALLADPRLAPRIGVLVARLYLPMLRIACRERVLFSEDEHPLRVFIDGLCELGTGWRADAAGEPGLVYARIAGWVEALATDPEPGSRAVLHLLAELGPFLRTHQADARLAARRAETAERALAATASGQSDADAVLRDRLDGRRLPAAAEELLREGWYRVLVQAHLRFGSAGAEWRRLVRVVDDFMALWNGCCYGLPDALAGQLREGLAAAGCDPLRSEILLASINEELPAWEVDTAAGGDLPGYPRGAMAVLAEADGDPGISVGELAIGDWCRIALAGGAVCTGRFAARLDDAARLLFVDGGGNKLLCMTEDDAAAALARGSLTVLAGGSHVAAALARVAGLLDEPVADDAQAWRKFAGVKA